MEDSARAEAASGEQARTIIAGYHWFSDWGRDSMISLEGLTLVTGRHAEARSILRTFISHVRDGLIPNFFPDRSTEGVCTTPADATMWYFQALSRYLAITGDRSLLYNHLPALKEIVACHQRGTRFGIRVDPKDGLLQQGADGYQLTWMDAKVGDWVVTPRRGKAVEINALWYNALRLLESWMEEAGEDAGKIRAAADRAFASFNQRFWCEAEQGLFDVIDGEQGDDPSCRPNQIFAISLPHPVLAPEKWASVLQTVQDRLLTPFGLRTLAPGSPDYKQKYDGDLRSRDAAYHQGTVWAWLIGPFVDAWLRVYPDRRDQCREFIAGFESHFNEACIGTISEIFDAEAPYTPRGCAAQAWSVAEVLRISSIASKGKTMNEPLWYKDAIIYEVHVRSFQDGNNDGIGDFAGLTQRLDYLADLGITVVWLLPFTCSPLKDDGYDISDYTSVHPHYGTLDDFRAFLEKAHSLGIRVITELVINHTSDQHPWFQRDAVEAGGKFRAKLLRLE